MLGSQIAYAVRWLVVVAVVASVALPIRAHAYVNGGGSSSPLMR